MAKKAWKKLIAAREADTLAVYRDAMEGANTVAQKVERLAAIRSNEGYMAEWEESEDGSLTLIENHCPICAAAATCQKFCRAELEIFSAVLGRIARSSAPSTFSRMPDAVPIG